MILLDFVQQFLAANGTTAFLLWTLLGFGRLAGVILDTICTLLSTSEVSFSCDILLGTALLPLLQLLLFSLSSLA